MDKSTTNVLPKPHKLLGDRTRVSIPLAPGAAGLLQTWWPTAFALKELTAAEEARSGALVKKAVG